MKQVGAQLVLDTGCPEFTGVFGPASSSRTSTTKARREKRRKRGGEEGGRREPAEGNPGQEAASGSAQPRQSRIVCRLVVSSEHVCADGKVCVAVETRCNGTFSGMLNLYVEPQWLGMPADTVAAAKELQFVAVSKNSFRSRRA